MNLHFKDQRTEIQRYYLLKVQQLTRSKAETQLRSSTFKDQVSQSVSSVVHLCPTLCDPMNCSTPGFPVQHKLLEFTQTHVHRVGDAIQPPHPLLSPSPPASNPS